MNRIVTSSITPHVADVTYTARRQLLANQQQYQPTLAFFLDVFP